MNAQLDAVIQRRGGADISAMVVVPPKPVGVDDDAEKEKAIAEKQTILKLSFILSRVKVGKKGVNASSK